MSFRDLVPWGFGKITPKEKYETPFETLQREVNSLFDNFFKGFDLAGLDSGARFTPRVNVTDSDKELTVTVELPGMDEKDIDVSLTKDSLTVKGQKKEEKEEKSKGYYHMERSYGSFSRTIPLPCDIESDKAEAAFKKGVLSITLPKTAEAVKETRKIAIKSD